MFMSGFKTFMDHIQVQPKLIQLALLQVINESFVGVIGIQQQLNAVYQVDIMNTQTATQMDMELPLVNMAPLV